MELVEGERQDCTPGALLLQTPARALRHAQLEHSPLTLPSTVCSQMKHPESNGNIAHTQPRGNTQMNKHAQT